MANITIRKARLADLPILVALAREFERDHTRIVTRKNPKLKPYLVGKENAARVFQKLLRQNLRSRNAAVYLAEAAGKPVGLSVLTVRENARIYKLRRLGHIIILYVKENHRGLGVSTKLYEEALQWFSKKRLPYISLNVMTDNPSAHAIYERWGFFDYQVEMRRKTESPR